MTFWEHFFRVLPWRPRQALAALYWHLTRRKVRARHRLREASANLPFAYDLWISTKEQEYSKSAGREELIEGWRWRPSFSVLLHSPNGCSDQQHCTSRLSIERQTYPFWTIVECASDAFANAVVQADGDYVLSLQAGDSLSSTALFLLAESLQSERSASILYGDHDELERGLRARPWFKPQWNEEMFLAQDFISPAVAVEAGLAREAAIRCLSDGDLGLTNFLLVATGIAQGPIVHLPHILCHIATTARDRLDDRLEAVARHVKPRGATCSPGPFGTVKVEWPLPAQLPQVSIIVPTRDRVELLQACVTSVLERTDYPEFEILIADNGSIEKQTLAYLSRISAHPAVRLLRYEEPYNFSAINNFAARAAKGSYLCLLNNDTEVINEAWLTEMMRYAVRDDVGAVGAKLLYGDGTIQHAGVVVGIGEAAGHAHRFTPADHAGYFRQAHVAQFVSAVTAACLVVDKTKFDAVGGLDEQHFAIAYNDVDFCLRLQAAGWRNAYVPHAVLLHHESKSRGRDTAPEHIDRYRRELRLLQDRWGTKSYRDPIHNPNLDRHSERFVIAM